MANKNMDLMESSAKVRLGTSDKIIRGFGYVFITFYAVCCVVPFLIIVSSSFTSEVAIREFGVQLLPKDFTLEAYKMVVKSGGIWWSYLLTIVMTAVGTGVGLSIISMTGYALQRRDFPSLQCIARHCREGISLSATPSPFTFTLPVCFLQVLRLTT